MSTICSSEATLTIIEKRDLVLKNVGVDRAVRYRPPVALTWR
jgi:hypothetical protein